MKNILENIKSFFSEIAQFIRRFMGPDLSESELLEDEYQNEYFYQKLNGFNELEPENKKILDEAMENVIHEESKMSMEEALKTAKKDKLSLKNTEKSNTRTRQITNQKGMPEANKNRPVEKEPKGVDRDV